MPETFQQTLSPASMEAKQRSLFLDPVVILGFVLGLVGVILIFELSFPLGLIGILPVAIGMVIALRRTGYNPRVTIAFSAVLITVTAYNALRKGMAHEQLQNNPTMGRAMVVDTGSYPAKVKGGMRWVRYSYTVEGETYTGQEYNPGYRPGDSITIRYVASDPSVSLPDEPVAPR